MPSPVLKRAFPAGLVLAAILVAPGASLAKRDTKALLEISGFEDRRSLGGGRLVAYLRDAEPETRAAAARALGRIGANDGVAPLAAALSDSDPTVRKEVIFALGQIGAADARDALSRIASSNAATEEREEAVLALGKLAGDGRSEAILPFLSDPAAMIRAGAAIALARTADSVAVTNLGPLLSDPEPKVRAAAAWATGRLKGRDLAEGLRPLLADADPDVRLAVTKAAGQIEDAGAIDALSLLARDPDWRVRVNVAISLGQTKKIEALAGLGILGEDANPLVRTAVAQSLFDIPYHYKKDDILVPLRKSVEPQVRAATLRPLAVGLEDSNSMLDEVWLAAGDSSTYVVDATYATWAEASDRVPQGGDMLAWRAAAVFYMKGRLVNPDCPLREQVSAAYYAGSFDTEWAVTELTQVLSQSHWAVTAAALHSLGVITPKDTAAAADLRESVPRIVGQVLEKDPEAQEQVDVRTSAAEALGHYPTDESKRILRGLLADPDWRVRSEAAGALEKLGEPRPEVAPRGELPGAPDPLDEAYIKSKPGRFTAILQTSRGDIEIELLHREAPRTVQSFVTLAESGFFDGLIFHRVVPNFVIQGGCPIGNGWGNPGYELRCEYSPLRYERGMVGMAHAGKDTGGSQFFITHSAQPHLDGRYTIFGRVVTGMEVVDTILVEDVIQKVEIKKKMW
jgi:cyclophilin family peptidyl-prolyl cis-trans isomerase/HEAT repeat protein